MLVRKNLQGQNVKQEQKRLPRSMSLQSFIIKLTIQIISLSTISKNKKPQYLLVHSHSENISQKTEVRGMLVLVVIPYYAKISDSCQLSDYFLLYSRINCNHSCNHIGLTMSQKKCVPKNVHRKRLRYCTT